VRGGVGGPTWWTWAFEDAVRIGLVADAEQIWVITSPRSAAETSNDSATVAQKTEKTEVA
jgi:hypothetical protein